MAQSSRSRALPVQRRTKYASISIVILLAVCAPCAFSKDKLDRRQLISSLQAGAKSRDGDVALPPRDLGLTLGELHAQRVAAAMQHAAHAGRVVAHAVMLCCAGRPASRLLLLRIAYACVHLSTSTMCVCVCDRVQCFVGMQAMTWRNSATPCAMLTTHYCHACPCRPCMGTKSRLRHC